LIGLIAILLLLAALFRRVDLRVLAPIAVLGGSSGFDIASYLANQIDPWFRYFILLVPLEILVVGALIAASTGKSADPGTGAKSSVAASRGHKVKWTSSALMALFALVIVGPSVPTTGAGILNFNIGPDEVSQLATIFHSWLPVPNRSNKTDYESWVHISDYIDSLNLPDGSIVVDNYTQCIPDIYTTVNNSKVFIIPNDRDFKKILADPLTFNAHYLLLPEPAGAGAINAISEEYPTMFDNGAGFARLVHQFNSQSYECPEMRLYHVTGHPPGVE
jgi:hypothetical protein